MLELRAVDVSVFGRYLKTVAMDDDGDECEDKDGVEGVPLKQPLRNESSGMACWFSVGRWWMSLWRWSSSWLCRSGEEEGNSWVACLEL